MSLSGGTRLGPYEIVAPIGAGGMGEVYRARDTNLDRDVAIKVLPESFALDADRVARFTREAKTLAALNHSNIAAIYGLEKTPDLTALVMELVEGEDLSAHIARGSMPIADVLPIARQIADALEAAHELGIVHRDLKPANIKVRPDGTVKVLDFGLAKAIAPDAAMTSAHLMQSPTITSPLQMTQMGVILGTAAYMAPEQAKGKSVDRRADIWAFGVVVHEMISGRHLFIADTVAETLAHVMTRVPDLDTLPASTPRRVRELIARCLEKDPRRRLRDIGEARLVLDDPRLLEPQVVEPGATAAPSPSRRSMVPWLAAAICAAAFGASLLLWAPWHTTAAPVTRLVIDTPLDASGMNSEGISPDGRRVVMTDGRDLRLRSLASFEVTSIPGSDFPNVRFPVFSPDGESVAFAVGTTLKRIPVSGGVAIDLATLPSVPNSLSWSGHLLLAGLGPKGIVKVPDGGGAAEPLVTVREGESAGTPQLLPGGEALLFGLATGGGEPDWVRAAVVVQTLASGRRDVVVPTGADARYVPSGHVIYAVDGVWFAVPFDLASHKAIGAPVTVIPGVSRLSNRGLPQPKARLDVSANGTLVYVPGRATRSLDRRIIFTTRSGSPRVLELPIKPYEAPRISPDGRQLALSTNNENEAVIFVYDLSGAHAIRPLTLAGRNRVPVWSPDGQRIAFQSTQGAKAGIFVQRADGSGAAEQVTTAEPGTIHVPESWSRDGEYLSFSLARAAQTELWLYSFHNRAAARFSDVVSDLPVNSVISPDGRWIAYTVREALRGQLFVQAMQPPNARYKLSSDTTAQHHPLWSPDGKDLFFFSGDSFFLVPITLGAGATWGASVKIPNIPSMHTAISPRNYDVFPDGREFVWTQAADAASTSPPTPGPFLHVVLNWFDELKALAPRK